MIIYAVFQSSGLSHVLPHIQELIKSSYLDKNFEDTFWEMENIVIIKNDRRERLYRFVFQLVVSLTI
jgi:hypothetical protein